jgi:hypothetical protein
MAETRVRTLFLVQDACLMTFSRKEGSSMQLAARILFICTLNKHMPVTDSMEGSYEAVGGAMKFCQLMQFLEVMHPLFGYTKGGVLTPLMQVNVNGIAMLKLHNL